MFEFNQGYFGLTEEILGKLIYIHPWLSDQPCLISLNIKAGLAIEEEWEKNSS